jgi:hypothetical protein
VALEYLLWKKDVSSTYLAVRTIQKLKESLDNAEKDPELKENLMNAIISGRLDKNDFKFDHTLIMGEDGGLFILLNNSTDLNNNLI